MLTLSGVVRSAMVMPSSVDRKTGEIRKARHVVQLEGIDHRGLVQLYTLTVPDALAYQDKTGQEIELPVRAWTAAGTVNFMYENTV